MSTALPPPPSTPAPDTTPATETIATAAPRIIALDVLRGFALCGIAFVNVEPVTRFGQNLEPAATNLADASGWLQLFVQQRFFPLFALLFGISFMLVFTSAQRRGANPRTVLLRRLLTLLPLGLLHRMLDGGEALTPYAVAGLLVLLPSTWLPRWAVAAAGAIACTAALILTGGGVLFIPGLFLAGSALVRYGVIARLENSTRIPLLLCALFTLAAVPALILQLDDIPNSGFTNSSGVAGAAMAGAYATALIALLRTPLRPVLVAAFAPLGRMALTNYVSATVVMVIARDALDLRDNASWATVLGLAAGILVIQVLVSTWWLARYRYGPLEWLWRWATWGHRPHLTH